MVARFQAEFTEPFFILVLTPPPPALFACRSREGREPPTPVMIFIGMPLAETTTRIMAAASMADGIRGLNALPPARLIGTYFVVSVDRPIVTAGPSVTFWMELWGAAPAGG